MKQIKIKKNIIDDYKNDIPKSKTPTNDNMKNVIQENNKTPKIIIKKTINIIFNKPDNNNISTKEEVKQEINETENKSEEKEINEAENKIEENEIKETENKIEENEIYETENKSEEKEIDEKKEQIKEIDQLENIENKNENNLEMNLDINRINFSIEDSDKKIENKFEKDKEFSIEAFTKYRKSKVKFIKNEEEEDSSNEQDITLTEKYQDCENFVYFLRTQLIYCFLANKNYDESFLD